MRFAALSLHPSTRRCPSPFKKGGKVALPPNSVPQFDGAVWARGVRLLGRHPFWELFASAGELLHTP